MRISSDCATDDQYYPLQRVLHRQHVLWTQMNFLLLSFVKEMHMAAFYIILHGIRRRMAKPFLGLPIPALGQRSTCELSVSFLCCRHQKNGDDKWIHLMVDSEEKWSYKSWNWNFNLFVLNYHFMIFGLHVRIDLLVLLQKIMWFTRFLKQNRCLSMTTNLLMEVSSKCICNLTWNRFYLPNHGVETC